MNILLLSVSCCFSFYRSPKKDQILTFYNEKISDLEKDYFVFSGVNWNPGIALEEKPIVTSEGAKEGYIVKFEKGYLGATNEGELLCQNLYTEPFDWNQVDQYLHFQGSVGFFSEDVFFSVDGTRLFSRDDLKNSSSNSISVNDFHKLSDEQEEQWPGFSIQSCRCPFQIVVNSPSDSFNPGLGYAQVSDFDYWNTICMKQQPNQVCQATAISNLLLTYKYSIGVDLTKGFTADNLCAQITSKFLTGNYGAFAGSVVPGTNSFLENSGFYLLDRAPAVPTPYVADYHKDGDLANGHSVMVIGTAISDHWWIFKTHWDLVLSWERNFVGENGIGEGIKLNLGDRQSIYLVDSQYRTTCFSLMKNGGVVTREHQ
jgi:hypothetical protein